MARCMVLEPIWWSSSCTCPKCWRIIHDVLSSSYFFIRNILEDSNDDDDRVTVVAAAWVHQNKTTLGLSETTQRGVSQRPD